MNWRLSAACQDSPPQLFHPARPSGQQTSEAKLICSGCPVRTDCLEFALDFESVVGEGRFGIFGGLTPGERSRFGSGRQQKPIEHGTVRGFSAHRRRGEPLCPACRECETRYRQERRRVG